MPPVYPLDDSNEEMEGLEQRVSFVADTSQYANFNLHIYLTEYWRRQIKTDFRIASVETRIRVGKRLFKKGTIHDCLLHKRQTDKICHLVRLTIPVDLHAKSSLPAKEATATYMG